MALMGLASRIKGEQRIAEGVTTDRKALQRRVIRIQRYLAGRKKTPEAAVAALQRLGAYQTAIAALEQAEAVPLTGEYAYPTRPVRKRKVR